MIAGGTTTTTGPHAPAGFAQAFRGAVEAYLGGSRGNATLLR